MCKEESSQDDNDDPVDPDSNAACQKCGLKRSRVTTSRSVESVETVEAKGMLADTVFDQLCVLEDIINIDGIRNFVLYV